MLDAIDARAYADERENGSPLTLAGVPGAALGGVGISSSRPIR